MVDAAPILWFLDAILNKVSPIKFMDYGSRRWVTDNEPKEHLLMFKYVLCPITPP